MADAPRMHSDPTTPIVVTGVDGKIVVIASVTVSPSLSLEAACTTAKRLIEAADRRGRYICLQAVFEPL